MRRVPSYHCQGEIVNALEDSDFKKMKTVFDEAAAAWIAEWQKQGSTDEGSCCGGKGIQVWRVRKGCRVAEHFTAVDCPPVQGNVSAGRSAGPALQYLEEQGIEATYYDGWMD